MGPQSSSASASSGTSTLSNQNPQTAIPDEELASKLEKMHEVGFWDDELNVRALQITEGNVEAAISLIIEGVEF
jgi:hypothetical protein